MIRAHYAKSQYNLLVACLNLCVFIKTFWERQVFTGVRKTRQRSRLYCNSSMFRLMLNESCAERIAPNLLSISTPWVMLRSVIFIDHNRVWVLVSMTRLLRQDPRAGKRTLGFFKPLKPLHGARFHTLSYFRTRFCIALLEHVSLLWAHATDPISLRRSFFIPLQRLGLVRGRLACDARRRRIFGVRSGRSPIQSFRLMTLFRHIVIYCK